MALPQPWGGGVTAPSSPPSPTIAPSAAPLTFCPFWPASPGLPWGTRGMGQVRESPKMGTSERRGALTALPGGPPWPLSPGGPGTASTVAAPSRACGTGGHCPHCSPCRRDILVVSGTGGGPPAAPTALPHLRAVPCNELHRSQLGRFHGRGREWGPGGVPITGLTFSPLSPRTPGSPLSPRSP